MRTGEIAVIGAGPIGIEVAVRLRQAGLDVVQFDAGEIGATLGWWAPGTKFFSSPERIEIAGVPLITAHEEKATREEYMAYLRQVVGAYAMEIHTFTRVVDARRDGDGFVLTIRRSAHGVGGPSELSRDASADTTGSDERWRFEKVVLAIGDMHRPRMLGCRGEDLPHVSHYLSDPHRYHGRKVMIVGGKNSAVEAAIRLYRVGADVMVCYRGMRFDADRIKYWLLPEIEWLIGKGKIKMLGCCVPIEIRAGEVVCEGVMPQSIATENNGVAAHTHHRQQEQGEGEGALTEVCVGELLGEHLRPGEQKVAEADDVLLLTGYEQDPELFEMLGVELVGEERKPVFVAKTMETNVPGVFVAGTATAGTQSRARVFIETSHVHGERIAAAITGREIEAIAPEYGRAEES